MKIPSWVCDYHLKHHTLVVESIILTINTLHLEAVGHCCYILLLVFFVLFETSCQQTKKVFTIFILSTFPC